MITLILLAAAYGGWRALRSLLQALNSLPRRNEDMIFY